MSTLEADDASRREVRREIKTERNEHGGVAPELSSPLDFNRLYGDLYQKLLNTPVQEIFPQTFPTGSPISSTPGSTKGNKGVPNGKLKEEPMNLFSPNIQDGGSLPPELLSSSRMKDGVIQPGMGSPMSPRPGEYDLFKFMAPPPPSQDELEKIASHHEFIDIPRLVEEFRITLERFGVSQRFAARFIMQDTSQGNLSFLMEKGKTKTWEELSMRGRIPYIKMKAWLESKDQQMLTLEMIKQSQEMKKYYSPREPYSRRERFSMFQLQVLCSLFEENANPPMNTRSSVAQSLNIPLDRVNVWFQNQRARGFPAKKILQNSLYNESVGIEKNENFANGRFSPNEMKPSPFVKEKNFLPMDGNVNGGDPFALLQNFTSSKLGEVPNKTKKHQESVPLKPSSHLPTSNMTTPEMPQPIDFSSFPFTHNPVLGQSTSGFENVPVSKTKADNQTASEQPVETPQVPLTSQQGSQSGAAKRKRGKVPRQIIRTESPVLPEEWKTDDSETVSQTKRVKLDDREQETIQIQPLNLNNKKHSKEREVNGVSGHFAQSNDARGTATNQNLQISDVTHQLANQDEGCDGSVPKETLVAIQSVCAHLLVEDKDKVKFEEPDLD